MKLVIYSNLHGVGPAIKQLLDEHPLISSVWSTDDATQLQELLKKVEPNMVLVGERGLFNYLALESQVFGVQLPPYKRIVISYLSPVSTELWGAELGFDGIIDGAEAPTSMVKKLSAVEEGALLLRNHPAFQPPMAFDPQSSSVIRCQDSIDEDIATLIAAGLEDAEIAELVVLPMKDLRKRIHRLISTDNIRNRTQLAVLYSRGLIDLAADSNTQPKS